MASLDHVPRLIARARSLSLQMLSDNDELSESQKEVMRIALTSVR